MGIYSGAGDTGKTITLSGQTVSKNSCLIHLLGTVDELNSHLGLIKAMLADTDAWQSGFRFVESIQKNLMKLMSHVSDEKESKYFFSQNDVTNLEKEIDTLTERFPKSVKFVIPGTNIIEAQIQIARTVARRTERLFTSAAEQHPLCPNAGAYLNRLSDYLFVLSQQESLINIK